MGAQYAGWIATVVYLWLIWNEMKEISFYCNILCFCDHRQGLSKFLKKVFITKYLEPGEQGIELRFCLPEIRTFLWYIDLYYIDLYYMQIHKIISFIKELILRIKSAHIGYQDIAFKIKSSNLFVNYLIKMCLKNPWDIS